MPSAVTYERRAFEMKRIASTAAVLAVALLTTPAPVAVAAEAVDRRPVTLLVPYPITGPREIQSSDRITRRYRAVAAHASPPITDAMASMIEAALLVGMDARVTRMRRDDPDAFVHLSADSAPSRSAAADLLLAGDDIARAGKRRDLDPGGRVAVSDLLLDPIFAMPFVLLCTAARYVATGNRTAHHAEGIAALRPRTLGTAGESSTGHLAAHAWTRHLGLAPLLVPYSGGNAVMSALVAEQIDAAFVALPLALGYIGHGKVRALAIASERRFERLPELPTLQETGAPVVVEAWFAVFGAARLPAQDAARIGASIRAYRLEQATQAEWVARGLIPIVAANEAFGQRLRSERLR